MKKLYIYISLVIMAAFSFNSKAAAGVFIKGLDAFVEYEAGSADAVLNFSVRGKSFKAAALWFEGSVAVAVEDADGRKSVVYRDGHPSGLSGLPKIGFSGSSESRSNSYMIGVHDFTNDGQPELVVAVTDGGDGVAIYVFEYDGYGWKVIGNMVTRGKGLGGCRIFRQALTMKDAAGILYTWTCHGSSFDFLSSDKVNDPTVLY